MSQPDGLGRNVTPEQRSILRMTRVWVERFFNEAAANGTVVIGGHGFDHLQRVAGMSAVIADGEGMDVFLPVFTALLFDVGRTSKDPRARTHLHGQLSVEMVSDYVRSALSPVEQELVLAAIADHPLSNDQVRDSYVIRVLQDADRIDTLGAIGPVRCGAHRWHLPLFTGTEPDSVEEPAPTVVSVYQDFTVRVPGWYRSIWTETARAIARPRLEFMQAFGAMFRKEAESMMESFQRLEI